MSRRFQLEIPPTLTDAEARLVIEILEEVIDVLTRQLDRRAEHERRKHEDWSVPEWIDEDFDAD
ncbi:MAG: hypothetical protein ABEK29_08035 [Bradymonadaceae bacterium]